MINATYQVGFDQDLAQHSRRSDFPVPSSVCRSIMARGKRMLGACSVIIRLYVADLLCLICGTLTSTVWHELETFPFNHRSLTTEFRINKERRSKPRTIIDLELSFKASCQEC